MIVALTGFMACGKSTFGRALAEKLGWTFVDLDEMTVPGLSAGEALRQMGVEAFRKREGEALTEALAFDGNCILALGGGTVLSESNRSLLRSGAKVIWLRTTMDIILSELGNSDRPLAAGLDRTGLEALLKQREPVYEEVADAVLAIDDKSVDKVIGGLVKIIGYFEK